MAKRSTRTTKGGTAGEGVPAQAGQHEAAREAAATGAAVEAAGVEPTATATASTSAEPAAPAKPPRGRKLEAVVAMLSGRLGASLSQIGELTGWQPHSVRAALSGLRKAGHRVEGSRENSAVTLYRIVGRTKAAGASDVGPAADAKEVAEPGVGPGTNAAAADADGDGEDDGAEAEAAPGEAAPASPAADEGASEGNRAEMGAAS